MFRSAAPHGGWPEDIVRLEVWQRYVGRTWQSMAEALSQIPVTLCASSETLHQAARRLAAAVAKSLDYIGFRHYDSPTMVDFFCVDRHDFPSARQ